MMLERLVQKLFHAFCSKSYHVKKNPPDFFQNGLDEMKEFFNMRFEGRIDFKGKTVLEVGCGFGSAVVYMAQRGATEVVGIDRQKSRILFAKSLLMSDYKHLDRLVEFKQKNDISNSLEGKKFDIILSKDSFEHYSDPANMLSAMKKRLKKNGIIVIGFGPTWKAPYGAHLGLMTKVPWVHLIFPESFIMVEARRYFQDNELESLEQVAGGLNKMTLSKFLTVVRENDLEFEYFRVNLSPTKLMFVFNILRKIPLCREYFTQNVYSLLRLPRD